MKTLRFARGRAMALRMLLVTGLVAGALAVASPAASVSPLPLVCTAAGQVNATQVGGSGSWQIAGVGTCTGDFEGTYFLTFSGTGTSGSIGLCGASLVATNLNINVVGTLISFNPFKPSRALNQTWTAPVTTHPGVTPFAILSGGTPIGLGNLSTRIFLQCPTGGSPAATFQFAFLT